MHVGLIPELIESLKPELPPVFLLGATGIGKTAAVAEGARRCGRPIAAIPPLSTLLPEDAGGIPIPDFATSTVHFMPPEFWIVQPNSLIFLDELNLARPDVLSALCSVLWPLADGYKRIGFVKIPPTALVIAAGMPPSGGSPARPLPHFLRSRLRIIEVEATIQDWSTWAILNHINPIIVSFLHRRPNLLAPEPPIDQVIVAFPCPRAWANLSLTLSEEDCTNSTLKEAKILGTIGPGATVEFLEFLKDSSSLPSAEDVLNKKAKFPSEPSAAIAVSVSVAQLLLSSSNHDWSEKYFNASIGWPAEFVIGIQFPAFQKATPLWRQNAGFDLPSITMNYVDWFRRFKDIIKATTSIAPPEY
jgi:hypothetical protein